MNIQQALLQILVDSEHNLRSGWKFAIYVALFITVWFITGNVLVVLLARTAPLPGDFGLAELGLNVAALFVPAVVVLLLLAITVDRVPPSTFGTRLHPGWSAHILAGIAIAFALLALLVAGSFLFGEVDIRWISPAFGVWAVTLLILMVGAANEELVFRGYPMQTLMKGIGTWPAVLIMSSIFGLLHSDNPNSTALGVLNTILAGIFLSVAYLKTRSLWLPYGIHIGWNLGLGILLGFPVSGIDLETLFATRTSGPAWILGGEYGPEGGVLATAVFLGGTLFLMKKSIPRGQGS